MRKFVIEQSDELSELDGQFSTLHIRNTHLLEENQELHERVAELEHESKVFQAQSSKFRKAYSQALDDNNILRDQLDAAQDAQELGQLKSEIAVLRQGLEEARAAEAKLPHVLQQIERLSEENSGLQQKVTEAREAAQAEGAARQGAGRALSAAQANLSSSEASLQALRKEVAELQIKAEQADTLSSELTGLRRELASLSQSNEQALATNASYAEQMQAAQQQYAVLQTSLQASHEAIKELQEQKQQLVDNLSLSASSRDAEETRLQSRIDSLQADIAAQHAESAALLNEQHEFYREFIAGKDKFAEQMEQNAQADRQELDTALGKLDRNRIATDELLEDARRLIGSAVAGQAAAVARERALQREVAETKTNKAQTVAHLTQEISELKHVLAGAQAAAGQLPAMREHIVKMQEQYAALNADYMQTIAAAEQTESVHAGAEGRLQHELAMKTQALQEAGQELNNLHQRAEQLERGVELVEQLAVRLEQAQDEIANLTQDKSKQEEQAQARVQAQDQEMEQLRTAKLELAADYQKIATRVAASTQALEEMQQARLLQGGELTEQREAVARLQETLQLQQDQLEAKGRELQRLTNMEQENADLTAALQGRDAQIDVQAMALAEFREQEQAYQEQLGEKAKEIEELEDQQRRNAQDIKTTFKRKKMIRGLRDRKHGLEAELSGLREALDEAADTAAMTGEQLQAVAHEKATLEANIATLNKQIEEGKALEPALQRLQQNEIALQQELAAAQAAQQQIMAQAQQQLQAQQQEIARLQAELAQAQQPPFDTNVDVRYHMKLDVEPEQGKVRGYGDTDKGQEIASEGSVSGRKVARAKRRFSEQPAVPDDGMSGVITNLPESSEEPEATQERKRTRFTPRSF